MIIYKVENKQTGKVYIGQTVTTLEERKKRHIDHSKNKSTVFYNALRSYGEDGFKWEVIDIAKTKEELNELEKHYINKYKSLNRDYGYNMVEGGTGGYNEYAVKANRKLRKGKKGKEWEALYDKDKLTELKRKMRETAIKNGYKYGFGSLSKEERIKYARMGAIAKMKTGYKHSEETKQKISEAQKGISYEERHGKKSAEELKALISQKTKDAMSKLDQNELQRKALEGRKKYWEKKHEDDRQKILIYKGKGYTVKKICQELDITPPTYYKRLDELKEIGKL